MGFGGIGMWEMVLVFLVVLLLFGAKRLPEIGASLGKGIREFKGSLREIEDELKVSEGSEPGQQRSVPPSPEASRQGPPPVVDREEEREERGTESGEDRPREAQGLRTDE